MSASLWATKYFQKKSILFLDYYQTGPENYEIYSDTKN